MFVIEISIFLLWLGSVFYMFHRILLFKAGKLSVEEFLGKEEWNKINNKIAKEKK